MLRSQESVPVGAAAPSLVRWGRSPDADLVYRMLVTFGPETDRGLRQALGMPAARVTAALEELRSIGAAYPSGTVGRDVRWIARPPAEVVARLRDARHGAPARDKPAPDALRVLGAQWPPPEGAPALGEGLRHLPSRAAARARMADLVAVARHEHLAMNTERSFDAESARAGVPMDRTLLNRGVRMRVLGLHRPDPDPMDAYGRRPGDPRPDYRAADAVPIKLIVVDRRVALFPVAPGDLSRGYLEITQPPLVAALVAHFERHWDSARPPAPPGPALALTPRERTLVSLLARGHTDTTAAREMWVSPRTVSSMLRQLMDRFGADNRFQLGLALGAAYADLLPSPSTEERR